MAKKGKKPEPEPDTLSRASSVSDLSASDVSHSAQVIETMTVSDVLAFCLPAGQQHACTTNRLYILADSGPLEDNHSYLSCICTTCQAHISKQRKSNELCGAFVKGDIFEGDMLIRAWGGFLCTTCKKHLQETLHVTAGFKSKAVVNDITVGQMARQVERDDILDAYNRNHDGSTHQEENTFLDLIKQEKSVQAAIKNLSRREIIEVFDDYVPKGKTGLTHPMSFYDAREAIMKHRAHRVYSLGLMYPEKKKNGRKAPRPKPVPFAPREGELPGNVQVGRETRVLYGRLEDTRLVHAHSCEIANLEDQHTPGLAINTRLLRNANRETNCWQNNF